MIKIILGFAAALTLPLAPILMVAAIVAAPHNQAVTVGAACAGWAGDAPASIKLGTGQMDRAALIYTTALDVGVGAQGAVVGIATAMQESTLGANPATRSPNRDADVGLFQQRSLVGWYADGATQAENLTILADDGYQARTFFLGHTTKAGWHIPGLADIPEWQQLSVTEAAPEGSGVGLPRRLRTTRTHGPRPGLPLRTGTRGAGQLRHPRPGL